MYWSTPPRYGPAPGYTHADYRTTAAAPPNAYYSSPKYAYYNSTPTKERGHARRASHEPASYSYTPHRTTATYYASPGAYGPKDTYYASYTTPKRATEYVSSKDIPRARPTATRVPEPAPAGAQDPRYTSYYGYSTARAYPKPRHEPPMYAADEDEGYGSSERSPPPPPHRHGDYYRTRPVDADGFRSHQAPPPGYRPSTSQHTTPLKPRPTPAATTARGRATSYSTPKASKTGAAAAAAASSRAAPRQATDADAFKAGIPAGYQFKNWDPEEEPILLLGSVFDANSIGKWIYDWTVYRCGAATAFSDMAGDLWLLLIQLSGKMKRIEEALPRIRDIDERELVQDFLDSGERLWERFNSILRVCENQMWQYMKKEGTAKKSSKSAPQMSSNSGTVFVDVIFGRDRQLESTEKLMTGMRLWSMRFDANCEDILRHPSP